jgi:hypothetical protein
MRETTQKEVEKQESPPSTICGGDSYEKTIYGRNLSQGSTGPQVGYGFVA